MYLFQRVVTLRGGVRRPLGWAVEMNAYVNANSGVEVGLWVANFGFPLGTVVWSARVESRAELAEVMGGLMAQDGYHELVERGQEFVAEPGQDHLRELIHPESVGQGPPPVGSVATIITATPNEGRLREALGWGVEIAKMYGDITGTPAAFYAEAYGTFGQVTWIVAHTDMAAADAASRAVQAAPDYLASIDGAGELFVPGSGAQGLATRIA
jgi:hypothetical protein